MPRRFGRSLVNHDGNGITMKMQTTAADLFGDTVYIYTRAQGLADGVLVDVSSAAREAGIVWPMAMSAAAWADCVEWTSADDKRKATLQDEAGRLWDVVWMASRAIRGALRRGHDDSTPIRFQLYRVPREGRGIRPRLVELNLIVGPGDHGEPTITVLQPGED